MHLHQFTLSKTDIRLEQCLNLPSGLPLFEADRYSYHWYFSNPAISLCEYYIFIQRNESPITLTVCTCLFFPFIDCSQLSLDASVILKLEVLLFVYLSQDDCPYEENNGIFLNYIQHNNLVCSNIAQQLFWNLSTKIINMTEIFNYNHNLRYWTWQLLMYSIFT